HNQTGTALTNDRWDSPIEILKARELIPLLDITYQRFGAGMEEGAYAIRLTSSLVYTAVAGNSFSKFFSLYGARVAGLSVLGVV
ncbi:aminotransferase class I/II-fold pyridoxal phosphate-dependent enzyme, partial [Escherichia coli]|nr:aminotransferase class I/II-fold pyridoxal phosphate-dependent enzyme [Escherichia coli]